VILLITGTREIGGLVITQVPGQSRIAHVFFELTEVHKHYIVCSNERVMTPNFDCQQTKRFKTVSYYIILRLHTGKWFLYCLCLRSTVIR